MVEFQKNKKKANLLLLKGKAKMIKKECNVSFKNNNS